MQVALFKRQGLHTMRYEERPKGKELQIIEPILLTEALTDQAMRQWENKRNQPITPSSGSAHRTPDALRERPPDYPGHLETVEVTRSGAPLIVRPAWPGDISLLIQLFNCLSRRTVEFRFLFTVKCLPQQWLEAFSSIDYERDVAMVASRATRYGERILGACHIFRDDEPDSGEVSTVVGDLWQRKGIGTLLLARSMVIARKLGMTNLWGLISADNKAGLAMARKFRFEKRYDPEEGLYRLERGTQVGDS